MPSQLSSEAIDRELANLPGWNRVSGRDAITRNYKFADFNAAFAFMTRVAMKAEQMNHHPEWFNVYSRVDVTLATHDAGGVTTLDIELARVMNGYAAING
jgi:4a-hydroxytetrahydrobiopterin dehydratase